ncbi:hypothetical protein L596_025637 [Steinernema carpocapsae]|uniref:Uncharacterized protein n=1 Tax=Steinernema carpocapsae TaxID=34508 RepID=A0A4U5M8D8_STECR|nr:hypothetical protein L596_025637 [Steinernema carpocapsae]
MKPEASKLLVAGTDTGLRNPNDPCLLDLSFGQLVLEYSSPTPFDPKATRYQSLIPKMPQSASVSLHNGSITVTSVPNQF